MQSKSISKERNLAFYCVSSRQHIGVAWKNEAGSILFALIYLYLKCAAHPAAAHFRYKQMNVFFLKLATQLSHKCTTSLMQDQYQHNILKYVTIKSDGLQGNEVIDPFKIFMV